MAIRAPVLAMVLLAGSLAGCVADDGRSVEGPEDGEVTMADVLPFARSKALAWRPEAKLTGVFGQESAVDPSKPKRETTYFSMYANDEAPDPKPGNGQLTAWSFTFVDPDDRAILSLVLDANGTQVSRVQKDSDKDRPYEETAVRWATDSDEALTAARANATFARGVAQIPYPRYTYVLARLTSNDPQMQKLLSEQQNETPELRDVESIWFITVSGEADGEWTWVSAGVDAQTGKLLVAEADSDDADEERPQSYQGAQARPQPEYEPWEHTDEKSGTMTLATGQREIPLPIEAPNATVTLVFEFGRSLPLGSISWELVHASGEVLAGGERDVTLDPHADQWEGTVEEPGNYAIRLSLGPNAVAVDYHVRIWAWGVREIPPENA